MMFGELHIEMAAFKLVGEWLAGSWWTYAIVEAQVATDVFTNVTLLSKTRYAHQVTAAALFILQKRAFDKYVESIPNDEPPVDYEL